MIYNIAIDADSLIYKSAYRHQLRSNKDVTYTQEEIEASWNIELAYFEFCQEIGKIRSAPFAGNEPLLEYTKGDEVEVLIVFSPKKSFRNELSPSGVKFRENKKGGDPIDCGYKANRKSPSIIGLRDLKVMVMERLKDWVQIVANVEADDVVNYYAREHNYMVAAIDKDVINANPTHSYNYNKFTWTQPHSEYEIEKWYLIQTLMGDTTDNVAGAPGIGETKAKNIVEALDLGYHLDNIVEHFDSEHDAIFNHWLVRMDQWNPDTGVELWQ